MLTWCVKCHHTQLSELKVRGNNARLKKILYSYEAITNRKGKYSVLIGKSVSSKSL